MRLLPHASVRSTMGGEIREIGGPLLQTDSWYGSGSMATRRSSLRGLDLLLRSCTSVRRVAVSSAVAAAVVDLLAGTIAVSLCLVAMAVSPVRLLLLMMLQM